MQERNSYYGHHRATFLLTWEYRISRFQLALGRVLVLAAVTVLVWRFTPRWFTIPFIVLVIFYALIEAVLVPRGYALSKAVSEMIESSADENRRTEIAKE